MRAIRLLLPLVIAASACAGPANPPPDATPVGRTVDPLTAKTLTGRVTFAGTPPKRELLRMQTDPACVAAGGNAIESDAVLVAPDGALQNVFIHLKDGIDPGYTFPLPTAPVVIDQQKCVYVPRVVGLRVGQPIEVVNSDATLHNVHALPLANLEFNQGQPLQGMRLRQTFTVPEVMIRLKCDVHGWMAAYVGVSPHPFFAVSGPDGSFRIAGVPPGTYTVEAWHERFGRQTLTLTVGADEVPPLAFSFKAE